MTEVGWIPKDWEVKTLEEIGNISKGRGVSRDQSHSGNLPCVRYGELYTSHDNYIRNFYSFISQEVAETAKRLNKGDVLFAASGETKEEIGKAVAFVGNEEAYAGGDIIILSPKIESDSMFLGFALNGEESVRQKSALGQGDAVVHIHAPELSKVSIAFPNPSEQRRIAQVLSDTDSLIASLSRTIEKKRLVKQGAMQQLLTGKTRLKGFSGEWGENTFEELFKTYSTASYSRDQMGKDGDVLCIHYGDIHVKYGHIVRLALEDVPTITEAQAGKFVRLQDGDIIMADASEDYEGAGKCIAVITNRKEAIAGLHTILLRPKENLKFDSQFTSYLLAGRFVKQQIENLAEGTKVYSISFKKIKDVLVRYPKSLVEQNAIANILTTMDNEIASLEAELQKYKSLKQGMMQKLLTGQIRLTDSTK